MMKKLGNYARTFLLEIFNKCWKEAVWPWTQSRVIFIRKPNKAKHDDCSSYRPLNISSHFGKFFERMLCTRVIGHLETNILSATKQEGFRRSRNPLRSLYRLHLNLEKAKLTRNPLLYLILTWQKLLTAFGLTVCFLN